MLAFIAGLSLVASVASAEPLNVPLLAPELTVEAPLIQKVATTTWEQELSLDSELKALAGCESTLDEKAFNPKDIDGEPKYGVFQYDADTWIWFQVEMGIEPTLNIYSGDDQLLVTRWAMKNGKASHWGDCL